LRMHWGFNAFLLQVKCVNAPLCKWEGRRGDLEKHA
jgi:hypothetical protein